MRLLFTFEHHELPPSLNNALHQRKRFSNFKTKVRKLVNCQGHGKLYGGPLRYTVTIYFTDSDRDLDNYATLAGKAITDFLKGILFKDDNQVTDIRFKRASDDEVSRFGGCGFKYQVFALKS